MSTLTKRVAFHTLGCKLNFSETATIARGLPKNGFEQVSFRDEADFYIINTCTVTNNADKECRKIIRQIQRRAPEAIIAVVGCYAQLKSHELAALSGVDLILGTTDKFDLMQHLTKLEKKLAPMVLTSEIARQREFIPSYSATERTRAFLKIQDGCDYPCSYCTIPLARGNSCSDTITNTVNVAREVAATGVREIVLTGVNIGDFGRPNKETFIGLIKELEHLDNIERFRISSIEPNLLTDEIIEFVARSKKFVPHFHIPLQSGSNAVLKAMQRRYTRELFAGRVAQIKSLLADCCIGADVIVGFPGETEEYFKETYSFLDDLDISYLHVFSYSERNNTKAQKLPGKVSRQECARRSRILHNLSDRKRQDFQKEFLNQTREVLFETAVNGFIQGHTDNYIIVRVSNGPEQLINTVAPVRLRQIENGFMTGDLIS